MSDHEAKIEVKMGSERNFGLVFAAVFALIALLPLLGGSGPRWIVLAIAIVFAAVAMFVPSVLRVPNRLWYKFGMLLGAIVAPIIMGLVFLIAFLPIGLILRASGKDLLSMKMQPDAKTYWIGRETPPKTMKLQY
jgi:hypothetical protein